MKVIFMFIMLFPISGCMPMLIDSLSVDFVTGKTYAELIPLPPHTSNSGRIFIYRTANSTKRDIAFGILGPGKFNKNRLSCIVNNSPFLLYWEVFTYWNLPMGAYSIKCPSSDAGLGGGGIQMQSITLASSTELPVSLQSAQDVYVRIDITDNSSVPVIVDVSTAKTEMANLPIQKVLDPYEVKMVVGW